MKNFKKTFCIIMALAMLIPSIALFAGAADKDDFIIENPYKNVDWTAGKPTKLSFTATPTPRTDIRQLKMP